MLGTNFQTGVTATLTLPDGSNVTVSGSAIVGSSATAFKMMVVLPTAGNYRVRAVNPSGQTSDAFAFVVK